MNILDILSDIKGAVFSPRIVVVSDRKVLVGGAGGALDVYSESTTTGTVWQFAGVAKGAGKSGKIIQAHAMLQTTNLTPRLVLFLFTNPPTCNLNDNITNTAVLLADMEIALPPISFPAMEDIGTGVSEAVATPSTTGNLPLTFTCGENILYGVVASRDALTPTALDKLLIKLTIEQL